MTPTELTRRDVPTIQTTEWSEELIRAIAMDIGKETVAYVEVMYPKAVVNSGFKLSLRNHIYNEIMAAIKVNDVGQIEARLKDRKSFRRWWVSAYRKIQKSQPHPFGYALPEMDVEAFLNLRDWLRSVIESGGTKITGTSLGCGEASLDIELDGMPYRVSIQPLPVNR